MDAPTLFDALLGVLGFVFTAIAYVVGYKLGSHNEAARTTERIEADRQHRRNRLLDRGRTTDRRPEHDGQASRVRPIHVSQHRVVPGDQRRPRM